MGNPIKPRPQSTPHHIPVWLLWLMRLAMAGLIVGGGVLVYRHLLATAPQHQRQPQGEREVVVEVTPLRRVSQPVTVTATGTVIPIRRLSLMAQVAGRVTEVDPRLDPGRFVTAGMVAVALDRTDYELAVRRAEATLAQRRNALQDANVAVGVAKDEVQTAESAVAQAQAAVVDAEYSYKLELGEQDVARHEWGMVEHHDTASELDRELTLRQPHLRKAEAGVSSAQAGVVSAQAKLSIAHANVTTAETAVTTVNATVQDAEAALAQARLDLERTTVTVPFDAVVSERAVVVGTQVSTQTVLATLVDRTAFWIEVSVPYDRLPWVQLPQEGKQGATAVVRVAGAMAQAASWQGQVVGCLPEIEANGRQARLLIEIAKPLEQKAIPLLLNTFVTTEIAGPTLADVFVIPRRCLHNGNEVWLRNGEGRLAIRTVDIVWGNEETVVTRDNLTEGEELVVSDISSPVSGLKLALPATATAVQETNHD